MDIPQAEKWADNKVIEFADLKLIEPVCKQKINMNQLVENMNEFKGKMFPGHSKKAALADEPPPVSPQKIDLSGAHTARCKAVNGLVLILLMNSSVHSLIR